MELQQFTQQEVYEGQAKFVSNVYSWMSGALALTGIVAMGIASQPDLINAVMSNRILFYGLLIGEFALFMYLIGAINRMSASTAIASFVTYAALNGVTLSVIFTHYTSSSIAATFFATGGTFAVMSFLGYRTKRDLSKLGGLLYMAVIGLIIATVVNIFWVDSTLYWITTYLGVFIFVGLTAYNAQRIKQMSYQVIDGTEDARKMAVLGSLIIYLDFINLFVYLLRFFGRRN